MIDWFDPVIYIEAASVLLVITVIISLFKKDSFSPNQKRTMFWIMVIPTVLASLYLAGHTVYQNVTSETKGPVHWHADYEVIVCGEKLELVQAHFPNNKIGSPLIHSHNDGRIHIEGVVSSLDTISLGNYFSTIGGSLTSSQVSYPTESGFRAVSNGDSCGNNPATLKVYVDGKKIDNPQEYVPYPSSLVPPGDCIIILFDDSNASTTSLLCDSWAANDWDYSMQRKRIEIGGKVWP
ncbi:hypothetical protein KW805_04400 [Candidatus Pacearchaeota archaeon]|nr:hypothetical protein [Candidatus Pacearchaeota archaeon]